jgi:hypothetical protein
MLIISAAWEVEAGGSQVQGHLQPFIKSLSQNKMKKEGVGFSSVVECCLMCREALCSSPSTVRKKKKTHKK